MTDIVERLRVWPAAYGEDSMSSTYIGWVMKQAADEIERLRAAQPQYLANCLRAGACHGACESTACTNYGKAIVVRRCVEPKQDGIVYPEVKS